MIGDLEEERIRAVWLAECERAYLRGHDPGYGASEFERDVEAVFAGRVPSVARDPGPSRWGGR